MEIIDMKKKESIRKMLRLVHSYDEDFIIEWAETRRKGILVHILKNTVIATVAMGIIGIIFLLDKHSMYGFEQNKTIFIALSQGFILGIIISLVQWGLGNERYTNLKEKITKLKD